MKHAGFRLSAKDVFLNIAGGLKVDDHAIDMAVICRLNPASPLTPARNCYLQRKRLIMPYKILLSSSLNYLKFYYFLLLFTFYLEILTIKKAWKSSLPSLKVSTPTPFDKSFHAARTASSDLFFVM
jgi:hypothetical protein